MLQQWLAMAHATGDNVIAERLNLLARNPRP
jgi:hypothetical protein